MCNYNNINNNNVKLSLNFKTLGVTQVQLLSARTQSLT